MKPAHILEKPLKCGHKKLKQFHTSRDIWGHVTTHFTARKDQRYNWTKEETEYLYMNIFAFIYKTIGRDSEQT